MGNKIAGLKQPLVPTCVEWKAEIQKVLNFCISKKWNIVFGKELRNEAFLGGKKIHINSSEKEELQLYFLLHEVGHMLEAEVYKKYHEKYFELYAFNEECLPYKQARVREELEAWDQGWKLSYLLGVHIELDTFIEIRSKSVATYMAWAAKKTVARKKTISSKKK